ncbi:4Fe-4S binding protein [Schauerella aestuarii]|uniref:4Fe-4S binding protein n=1 Tax=Schauerella aestuarii TaxID=2511204 RepID=UPI0013693BA4|nr:4Fe-4S binding protein [Achromobacter aestuarii]MYZ43188.1 4Fe-4S binding protein [Achromobacter aestuarii]
MTAVLARSASRAADFLRDHAALLRKLQWGIVLVYAFLLIVPAIMPLPDNAASVFNNLTVVSQFAFWGIWWPFVLVSMPLLGRTWCGTLCPEGMLSEWASEHGQGHAIPKWMRWGGWPFVAFAGTTVYGQLISVYQYPAAVLVVLGGSTVAAMIVGWRYGRSKRVWCKYLCPVNGVFNLLAKMAPWHFKVDETAWRHPVVRIESINCAPLVPLRHMKGAGDCHMCGRCSGYRGAIALTPRSPEEEIVNVADGDPWQTALILFGMMGLAMGAFLWSASPWFVVYKQAAATWLVEHDILWPLLDNAPWYILTHYPELNDSFSWLDGSGILLFVVGAMVVIGGAAFAGLWVADRMLPQVSGAPRTPMGRASLHKLAQCLIPVAGVGVFLGLSATTLTLLKHEGMGTGWANSVRFTLLALAVAWSLKMGARIIAQRHGALWQNAAALAATAIGLVPFVWAWILFFVVW